MAFSFGAPAGQQQQQGGTGAGSSGPSTFSFGGGASSNTNQQQQQQPSNQPGQAGGFSFGQPSAQQQQPQQQQQQQQQQNAGGFSFGQPQQQQQPQQGGLFGQSQGAGSSTGGGLGSSLFGGAGGQSKPAFSFGSSTTSAQPQQQQQQQQQQPQFGQSQLGQSQFGQSQLGQSQFGQSQLGASQLGGRSQQQQQQQNVQPQQDKKLGSSLVPKMEVIRQAWDTNNLQTCRFLTYFYNNIPPGVLPPTGPVGAGGGGPFDGNPNFGRRQDAVGAMHDTLWEKAVQENPDRTKLVPVLAIGFNDLHSRVAGQERETERQAGHLKTIMERLSAIEQKQSLSHSVRAQAALKRQAALHHRVVGIAKKSHVLVPALRGSAVTREEEQLRLKLETCQAELGGSNGTGGMNGQSAMGSSTAATSRLRARVNEMWAVLGAVKAKREALERQGKKASVEWAVVDEDGAQQVTNILAQQQQGLNHLINTLEEDTKSLDTVLSGLKGVELVGVSGRGRTA